jgi:hypothetical protein
MQRTATYPSYRTSLVTTGAIRLAALVFPTFTVFTTCVLTSPSDATPFHLFSSALPAGIVGNFTLTIFFAIATQSSQPHRNLRQRANSLSGCYCGSGEANRRSGPVSHHITLARVSIKRLLTNTLTVRPVLLDHKRGVYRDNIATSLSCASHWHRLGNFCP